MASRPEKSMLGYFVTAAISVAVTAFSFALTQCNSVQTKEAARSFEDDMKKEHIEFRQAITANTALINEKFILILERLPPKH